MSNQSMRTTLNVSMYIILILAVVATFMVGPRAEVLLNPPIGGFEILKRWQEEGPNGKEYFISGALLKNRGECEPIEIVMTSGGGISDENSRTVRLDFSKDPSSISAPFQYTSRPEGAQHWGPWRVFPPTEPIGPIISLYVRFRCHALWTITQQVYVGPTVSIFPGLNIDKPRGT